MSARSAGRSDELSEQAVGSGASVVTAATNPSPSTDIVPYKTVWDFERIEKIGGPEASTKEWKCGWCGLQLKSWNATKALAHVSKAAGNNDVKACSGNIPKDVLARFRSFCFEKLGAATFKRQREDALSDSICENQQSLSVMVQNNRSRTSNSFSQSKIVDMTGGGGAGVAASNSTNLTAAIAEFVYCRGLAFSMVEGDHFLRILQLAKLVGPSNRPPSRKAIGNELLDYSYESRLDKSIKNLEVDANLYGISLFGDGRQFMVCLS